MNNIFDLVVIGAGSGGLAAAKRAASHGAKVALIEGSKIGGTCVIRGCVPKKLMVYAAIANNNIKNSNGYGISLSDISFDSEILLKNVRNEVSRLSDIHFNSLQKLNVKVFNGWGHFVDQNHIDIVCPATGKSVCKIRGEKILIAVGGRPNTLRITGSELLWSSNEVFELNNFPKSILIVGGGYIACEFACIFRNLGIDTTQVIRSNNLLNGFDNDLSSSLKEIMVSSGIDLLFNEELSSVVKKEDSLAVSFKSGLKKVFKNVISYSSDLDSSLGIYLTNVNTCLVHASISPNSYAADAACIS